MGDGEEDADADGLGDADGFAVPEGEAVGAFCSAVSARVMAFCNASCAAP